MKFNFISKFSLYLNHKMFLAHDLLIRSIYGKIDEYYIDQISKPLLHELKSWADNQERYKFSDVYKLPSKYITTSNLNKDIQKQLDANLLFYPNVPLNLVEDLHREIYELFRERVSSKLCFINTRVWSTKPNSNSFGPTDLHKDGFMPGHLKVMVYLDSLNTKNGSLKIENIILNDPRKGLCVLFQNSNVLHAGIPGTLNQRVAFEVTLMRSFFKIDQFFIGHQNGRHYSNVIKPYYLHMRNYIYKNIYQRLKSWIKRYLVFIFNKLFKPTKINIGSGIRDWFGWLLIDEIPYLNIKRTLFNEDVVIPANDNSVKLIYSSHNFEHLEDSTVERLLDESWRCLKGSGFLLIKIPDFDWFLDEYKKGNTNSFSEKGVESVMYTWENTAVEKIQENKLSMMFCGYWNNSYGDHFTKQIHKNSRNAYHGPAKIEFNKIKNLFLEKTPYQITKYLKSIVAQDPDFSRYNHQNAWSKHEFENLLSSKKFKIISSDKKYILSKYSNDIPDLLSMESWSMYMLAQKNI